MSPLLKTKFPGDHDAIDTKRKALDQKFKDHVLDNYEMVDFQNVQNEWMTPGRGVFPERSYDKNLEFFTSKRSRK